MDVKIILKIAGELDEYEIDKYLLYLINVVSKLYSALHKTCKFSA